MELDVDHVQNGRHFGWKERVQVGGSGHNNKRGVDNGAFVLCWNRGHSVGGEVNDMDKHLSMEQLSLTLAEGDDDGDHFDGGKQSCFTVSVLSPRTIHSHLPIRCGHCHCWQVSTEHCQTVHQSWTEQPSYCADVQEWLLRGDILPY